ncbi:helix-turn-helix transcriptional regulator [Paeniglutamicibacter sp. NPDC012692]|uniref:helix-turn-helix transcriptional regulator n=1 Tax=Paeniglutamicibacter sp. NPDC012692 TaxID=3364388 RepID=UPI003695ED50
MRLLPKGQEINALSALADPVRGAVYEFVRTRDAAVGRDEVATALGLPRNTVAFQLDRLADEGLLSVEFRRLSGKGGPGSGRPSKLYAPRHVEISASVPHREYGLAAELMAKAIERASAEGRPVAQVLAEVAREAGEEIGANAPSLTQALTDHGYRPEERANGSLGLLDCPFHQLSTNYRETVCSMNLELLSAVVDGTKAPYRACFETPNRDGHCCVRLDPEIPAG